MFDLKESVRRRFRRYVVSLLEAHSLAEIVLVVDSSSLKLLSNLFKLTELVDLGVTLLERLDLKRKVLDTMHALYFIDPSEASVKLVIQDWKDRKQYSKLHLLFTTTINKSNLKLLSLEPNILKHLARHSIKEFFLGMYFVENNTFTLRQDYMKTMYSEYETEGQKKQRGRVAARVADLFYSLGDFYQVNVYYNNSVNGVSRRVAEEVKRRIEECVGILLKNKSRTVNAQAEDVELIILDRSLDPITPLLHDLRYESMLFDLLGLQLEYYPKEEQKKPEKQASEVSSKTKRTDKQKQPSEKYRDKKGKDTEEADLKEEVPSSQELKELPLKKKELPKKQPMPKGLNQVYGRLYEEYRYLYLPTLMERVPADIERHKDQINAVTVDTATEVDANLTKELSLHHMLVRECIRVYKDQDLETLIGLEQCLATGINPDGKQTSSVELLQKVHQLVRQPSLLKGDKLRLGLLTMCCINLSEGDFKSLRDEYADEQDRKALDNLLWLGISVSASVQRSTKNINEKSRAYALEKMQRTSFPLSRHTSVAGIIVPIIMDALLKGLPIDQSFFSRIVANANEKKQLDRPQPREERKKRRLVAEPPRLRKKLVLFFVGGVSFSEISELRSIEMLGLYDLVIGTDQLLTPQTYVSSVLAMKERA